MTLEDFFTLTEMNNGLTATSRVRELVAVMQTEKDDITKNLGDSTRQWSAVASAIAATENKECLDLFIQLDGLNFIDKWLKDAQKFSNENSDSFVDESITHLLQALEKLHVDYEIVVASEIWKTVKDLLVHNSSKVQDKARVLFESWEKKSNVEKTEALTNDEAGKNADIERDASISLETSVEKTDIELIKEATVVSTSSEPVRPCQIESSQDSDKILDSSVHDDEKQPSDHVGPPSLQEPTLEPPTVCDSVGTTTSVEPCDPAISTQDTLVTRAESPSNSKLSPKIESSHEQLGSLEESKTSAIEEPSSEKEIIAGDKKDSLHIDSSAINSDGKSALDDKSYADDQCNSSSALITKEKPDDFINHHTLNKASSGEKSWGTFLSGIGDEGKMNTLDLENNYDFSKKQVDRKKRDGSSKKKSSDVELDYEIVDPLEVARLVAIEVEREVGDYREQSCSSSEKPRSENGTQSHSNKSSSQSQSKSQSQSQSQSATSTENQEVEETNETQDMAISQVTEAAQEEQEVEANLEKLPCNFDLNEEICSEDGDGGGPTNRFSAPIVSIVSASRAAAAPGQIPTAPLQFEGNLGWKGSAATSAFRPAWPRKIPDKEPQQGFLDFDLNVTESSVDFPESSGLGESWNSKRFELDLNNHASEDGPSKQMNFNLNDQPSFLQDSSENSYLSKFSQNFNVSGGIVKSDDSVISIMGTRVEVNRKDFVPQNSVIPFHGGDVNNNNLGRTGNFLGIGSVVPYSHYGYNNVPPGPAMPFPYGSGGPIPYMVDSRGAPVIPQFMGPTSNLQPSAFSQQSPFLMNMNMNTSNLLNGVGPSRSSFDLTSGMMMESASSKDPAGFGRFLSSGQDGQLGQLRSNFQPTSVGEKRKEPENGWENNYPFKHFTPPWK